MELTAGMRVVNLSNKQAELIGFRLDTVNFSFSRMCKALFDSSSHMIIT